MTELAGIIRRQQIRYLVQRAITCPATGTLLDARTCVVLNDTDGDPAAVISAAGWANIPETTKALLAGRGLTPAN